MTLSALHINHSINNIQILQNMSVGIVPGRVTGLLGPNGAGKTSILKVLAGEILAKNGSVDLAGESLGQINSTKLAKIRSVMSQKSNVVFDFKVVDILRMGWVQGSRWGPNTFDCALHQVVGLVDIARFLGRSYNSLSGGEQQRVQFAKCMLQIWRPTEQKQPARYLLLDEPTASLDIAHELKVLKQLRIIAKDNVGVVVVLHDLNLAARFTDYIYLLKNGEVERQGSPDRVLESELLSEVYQTELFTERHNELDRLIIHTL
jgi:iron complex transport system ATP-binding protein